MVAKWEVRFFAHCPVWRLHTVTIACHPGLPGLKRRLSSRRKFLVQCMAPKAHKRAHKKDK
jgi:hypothetical protein